MIKITKIEGDKTIVKKKWGYEIIIHNDEKYCGKILKFYKGSKFSLRFHIKKSETWYVNYGVFNIRYIDTETANTYTDVLEAGDIIEIPSGTPHQLLAVTDGEIFEASTPHDDNDSYRIEKGDSQL